MVERVPHVRVRDRSGDTGAVEILRYVVSEDCGVMINPNVVEGQIAGGVVQGIGGVLYEHMPYDDAGNPLATTFVDYLLPTATEVPEIEYGHIETPAPTNPGGHKGLGEGGAIGAARGDQRDRRRAGAARRAGPVAAARARPTSSA